MSTITLTIPEELYNEIVARYENNVNYNNYDMQRWEASKAVVQDYRSSYTQVQWIAFCDKKIAQAKERNARVMPKLEALKNGKK